MQQYFTLRYEQRYPISTGSRLPISPGSGCHLRRQRIQTVNFLGDRFLRKTHHFSSAIEDLYRYAMDNAFSATESFLVTGAPHASAYYPRDFAWFYPDVLDPETIMDSQDAVRRFVCSKRVSV
jgi:hypothetical protein